MSNTDFEDGVYDISNEVYHAANGISRSKLILLNKSPYHFWYEVFSGKSVKKDSTPAMNIGSAFHTLLLEEGKFHEEFAVAPTMDRRTAKGKEFYAEFIAMHGHKIILTSEQYEQTLAMVNHVKQHEIVTTLIEDAVFEQSIFWTDKETGLQFKARPDIWAPKMVVDLKTTVNAGFYSFQRSSVDYGYYLQAGMIFEACKAMGIPFEMFVHLVCEKEPPYVPAVYMLTQEALQFGIDHFNRLKQLLSECVQNKKWEAYPVRELHVPQYALVSNQN